MEVINYQRAFFAVLRNNKLLKHQQTGGRNDKTNHRKNKHEPKEPVMTVLRITEMRKIFNGHVGGANRNKTCNQSTESKHHTRQANLFGL